MSADRICLVCPYEPSLTETFIRAHIDLLPAALTVKGWRPAVEGKPVLPFPVRTRYRLRRTILGEDLRPELTAAYFRAFRHHGITAVLAEYGSTGVDVLDACSKAGVRLTVHFHGFDAFETRIIEQYREGYTRLFAANATVVAVSQAMKTALIELGASPGHVFVNPCGVDSATFTPTVPSRNPPIVLAVGRFTEKKAPQLTLLAFAEVCRRVGDARLRMVGTGPLLDSCYDLAIGLGIADRVDFLGPQPPDVVRAELKGARVFVQHSVRARNGDCEGSPVSIAEAAATGGSAGHLYSTRWHSRTGAAWPHRLARRRAGCSRHGRRHL
jgi:glycosyltransferase involved in cell wall biosynthesis